jgi:hypothetical protein
MRLGYPWGRGTKDEQPLLSRFPVRPLGYTDQGNVAEAQGRERFMHLPDLSESAVDE